ncbi:MAG: SCP2 sterol-binding domain-containing protein, partial [Pseudomonadota bacterium]
IEKERSRCFMESVKDILEIMPSRFNASAAGGLDVVFQFDISGKETGQWNLAIKDQACNVNQGTHPAPSVTLSMDSGDFVDLMNGRLSGPAAFFSGKLRVSGDLMLAQRLESLFKK